MHLFIMFEMCQNAFKWNINFPDAHQLAAADRPTASQIGSYATALFCINGRAESVGN